MVNEPFTLFYLCIYKIASAPPRSSVVECRGDEGDRGGHVGGKC